MTNYESYLSTLHDNKDRGILRPLFESCLLEKVEYYRNIARTIRSRRRALDLSQEALAEIVGCSTETIGRIEASRDPNLTEENVYEPAPHLLAKIIAALDLQPAIMTPIK